MTASYSLAPEPIWYIVNENGTAAGGAFLFTWSNINPLIPKPTYRDPGGQNAWPNPIQFDMNGTNRPIYFEFDPANPTDTYFLEVKDAQGNPLWQAFNFFPGGGGGGGGDTVTYLPLRNYIANNQFIDNTGSRSSLSGITSLVIAPSNHQGFTPYTSVPIIGTYGAVGPDIMYVTNAASIPPTDQITIQTFPLNTQPMVPSDVTPAQYIEYICTISGNEAYKAFQFPITQKVINLSQQVMTFSIWAKVAATPVAINLYTRQYYGSSPSATTETNVGPNPTLVLQGTRTLSTVWTQYFINFNMPNVATNSLGTPGAQTDDDAVYLQLGMPLNTTCDVLFTKPKLYLGTLTNTSEFEDYDEINSINSTPRCGDIRVSLYNSSLPGWVHMNDGSIGNVNSNATSRANADTFQLYKTIWDGVSNTYAPVQNSSGIPLLTRGATALADFLANNRLVLPLSLGRALANAGSGAGLTPRVLGQYLGSEVITLSALPSHAHQASPAGSNFLTTGTGFADTTGGGNIGTSGLTGFTGGSGADGNMQPTTFFNIFIKL